MRIEMYIIIHASLLNLKKISNELLNFLVVQIWFFKF